MSFRKKRMVLLSSVAILLLLSILDISIRKEEIFEAFGEQFLNERKTNEYMQAQQGVMVTSLRQVEINRPDIKEVSLSSISGKISVKRAPDQIIRLHYTVTASAADVQTANGRRDAVEVEEEAQNGRLTLVPKAAGRSIDYDSVSIDYVLFIPDSMKLRLENEAGAVRISGINGDVEAVSVRGTMEIVDVKGYLSMKSSNGSIYLSGITGNIDLENRYSKANIEDTKGAVMFDSQSGQNVMNSITGKVTGSTRNGSVHLREIAGPVELNSRTSDVQLNDIRGNTTVVSKSGDTTFILPATEGYTLDVAVNGGRIHSEHPLTIHKEKDMDYEVIGNGVIGAGTWKVDVKARSGDLTFHVK